MITWLDQEHFIFTNWQLAELTQFRYQANTETKDAHQAQLRLVSKGQHHVSTAQSYSRVQSGHGWGRLEETRRACRGRIADGEEGGKRRMGSLGIMVGIQHLLGKGRLPRAPGTHREAIGCTLHWDRLGFTEVCVSTTTGALSLGLGICESAQ